jgi:hypothetical protein
VSVPTSLEKLVGEFDGTYRLIRSWETPPQTDSQSEASLEHVARGKFLTIAYTWAVDGTPHEGILLLGQEGQSGAVHAVWVDSWHMSEKPLICAGRLDNGTITVVGSYAAPPGPDWRWRTVIVPSVDGSFEMTMYNISPAGEEELAVESRYRRR